MRALRWHGPKDLRVEDVGEPGAQPGQLVVDVAWCGICGTDLHEYLEGPIFVPTAEAPHPLTGESVPITLGHEFAGVVAEVGAGVDDVRVGDRVVVEPTSSAAAVTPASRAATTSAGHWASSACPVVAGASPATSWRSGAGSTRWVTSVPTSVP